MSWLQRLINADKRKARDAVSDAVPADQLVAGCQYCDRGWAHGPGLVYRCGNCNEGEPFSYEADTCA